MLNVEIFAQSYTEFFLKGIVLRELHRGVLLERVSGFKFQVCGTKFTTSVHFRTGREVLHRDARNFFQVDCVERVAQRRFTRTSFKFQVSDFKFLNVDFFGTRIILI